MAKLLVQESSGAREFELVDLEVNIGRELDNTLRLADPSISRHHAVIRKGPAGYEIQDLQSSNGVLLNGTRIESGPLRDGDRITLGQMQVTFLDPPQAPGRETNPLGTVRIGTEAMARLRASTGPEAAAEAGAPAAGPAPLPVPPTAPAPAEPVPAATWQAAPAAVTPGNLGFLEAYLPGVPDDALPVLAADGSIERGDFATRALANLIDYLPVLVLSLLGALMSRIFILGCILGSAQLLLAVAYLIVMPLCWMQYGASPGKKAMKLRVVPEADPSGRIDLAGAIMRLLGYLVCGIVSGIIMSPITVAVVAFTGPALALNVFGLLALRILSLAVAAVPYLLILGAQRRGLEDIFSRSIVIKVDR